jgi:phospholipase C
VAAEDEHLDANRRRASTAREAGSPTETLTAGSASAGAALRVNDEGDRRVMVAFSLGWQMAEVYRPDRRGGARPAAQDDLPGISRLNAAERQEIGLFQVQAGITKLRDSICDAGLEVPDSERFAEDVIRIRDPEERRGTVRNFHVGLLATLTAADFRLGKAYGLGRALADTTRRPPDWRAELDPHRVSTLAGWIRELGSALPPHAAHPVAQSLEAWSRWARAVGENDGATQRKLSAQGRLWRSLLSGEKHATGVLETSDYLRAGEGMLSRAGALTLKFLSHYWWLVLAALALLGLGIWLIVGPGSGVAAGLGGVSIFASLGLSWKGVGTSLGTAGARVEEPLWQAELDQVIYERITPDEIVMSQRNRRPGPDEPSLVVDTHEREPRHETPDAVSPTSQQAGGKHMSNLIDNAERAALREVAHVLPKRLRRVVELIAEDVPPTPTGTIAAPADTAVERLQAIDHVVVLMLENRSFDHMLGYLSLPPALGGAGRHDVDGLVGPEVNVNRYDGSSYAIHHLDRTRFAGETEDPDHSGRSVDEQLSDDCGGFVANFARVSAGRASKVATADPDPGLVMGYYDGHDLPVYNHLAAEYCVVDRWFSSVPGATWPNRLYSLTGQAAESRDDISPPIYSLPAFPRYLDQHDVDWGWYSFDPATLRAVDPAYRLGEHHRFAFVDARKLSTKERIAGEFLEEGPSFLDDVAAGRLPAVSWIDPRFKDLRVLGPDSNDDHPPSDVLAGQDLVLTLYHALSSARTWSKTLFVVTYDEHGGFYDHVVPPSASDDHPDFQRLGVRVPTILISPLVARGSTSTALLGPAFHFDHTSLIKTIFTRFCNRDGQIPAMGTRMAAANHLGHLLSDAPARAGIADASDIKQRLANWDTAMRSARFGEPLAQVGDPRPLTDFQTGFYDAARRLREAGLPAGHP